MPLSGTVVVDLSRIIAGPFCTALLGDMGAEIIKIETPGKGDPLRKQGAMVDGLSWYYALFNRNKKSVCLNTRDDQGKAVLARLLEQADVVVENFRPGVMEKMGFGPDRLKEINPDLIQASVTGFGCDGPYSKRPAFDFIAQAMSGLMSLNGEPEGGPVRDPLPITDLISGLYAAFGVACSLVGKRKGGGGEKVQVAMVDGIISFFAYMSANYLATGQLPQRTGNDHPIVAPYGVFRTSDGEVALAPSNDGVYQKLLSALGLERLNDDPRFATNDLRMTHRSEINAFIEEVTKTETKAHWVKVLNEHGVPCGVIQNLEEVFNDPQVLHQQMVMDVEQPGYGTIKMTGFPVKLENRPCKVHTPAPELGQHTQEILTRIGLSPKEMAALRENGII